jgi:hypothetical protein
MDGKSRETHLLDVDMKWFRKLELVHDSTSLVDIILVSMKDAGQGGHSQVLSFEKTNTISSGYY